MEEWALCQSFSRYEVSNLGRVRNRKTGRLCKSFVCNGWLHVGLVRQRVKNGRKDYPTYIPRVHTLVIQAFSLFVPEGRYARFKDKNRLNCRFDNLYYATRKSITEENWSLGKMKGSLKSPALRPGPRHNRYGKMEKHPNWNPQAPYHLKHLKYKRKFAASVQSYSQGE